MKGVAMYVYQTGPLDLFFGMQTYQQLIMADDLLCKD